MQETICNLCIVTIIGNLALMGAIPVAGVIWFTIGDYFKGMEEELARRNADAPAREYPRE